MSQTSGPPVGVYEGALRPAYAYGRCKLSVRYATFDSPDDADDLPEMRAPANASLKLTPNVRGTIDDGTSLVGVLPETLTTTNGEFEFWAIDGTHSDVSPNGWTWKAELKVGGQTWATFDFTPDSTLAGALDLRPMAQGGATTEPIKVNEAEVLRRELTGQLSGYQAKTVSGAATISATTGTWALDVAAPTVLTIDGDNGATVALDVTTAGGVLTVTDGPTITESGLYALLRSRGLWKGGTASGGGGISEPTDPMDTTPPTAGTLTVATGQTTADLSVSGAMDDEGLHAQPYAFKVGAGAWSAWQAAATFRATGLTADTEYAFQHRVRDAAGNITDGGPVTKATGAVGGLVQYAREDFNQPDGTPLSGLVTSGVMTWGSADQWTIKSGAASVTGSQDIRTSFAAKPARVKLTAEYDLSKGGGFWLGIGTHSGTGLWVAPTLDSNGQLGKLSQGEGWAATYTKQTGHPKTGTIAFDLNLTNGSGVVSINGEDVGTIVSTDYDGQPSGGIVLLGPDTGGNPIFNSITVEVPA